MIGLDEREGTGICPEIGEELLPVVRRVDAHIIAAKVETHRIPAPRIANDWNPVILTKRGVGPDLSTHGKPAGVVGKDELQRYKQYDKRCGAAQSPCHNRRSVASKLIQGHESEDSRTSQYRSGFRMEKLGRWREHAGHN